MIRFAFSKITGDLYNYKDYFESSVRKSIYENEDIGFIMQSDYKTFDIDVDLKKGDILTIGVLNEKLSSCFGYDVFDKISVVELLKLGLISYYNSDLGFYLNVKFDVLNLYEFYLDTLAMKYGDYIDIPVDIIDISVSS